MYLCHKGSELWSYVLELVDSGLSCERTVGRREGGERGISPTTPQLVLVHCFVGLLNEYGVVPGTPVTE